MLNSYSSPDIQNSNEAEQSSFYTVLPKKSYNKESATDADVPDTWNLAAKSFISPYMTNTAATNIIDDSYCSCHPVMLEMHKKLDPSMHSWNCTLSLSKYAQRTCIAPFKQRSLNPVVNLYQNLLTFQQHDLNLLANVLKTTVSQKEIDQTFKNYVANLVQLVQKHQGVNIDEIVKRLQTTTISSRAKQIRSKTPQELKLLRKSNIQTQNQILEQEDPKAQEILTSIQNLENRIIELHDIVTTKRVMQDQTKINKQFKPLSSSENIAGNDIRPQPIESLKLQSKRILDEKKSENKDVIIDKRFVIKSISNDDISDIKEEEAVDKNMSVIYEKSYKITEVVDSSDKDHYVQSVPENEETPPEIPEDDAYIKKRIKKPNKRDKKDENFRESKSGEESESQSKSVPYSTYITLKNQLEKLNEEYANQFDLLLKKSEEVGRLTIDLSQARLEDEYRLKRQQNEFDFLLEQKRLLEEKLEINDIKFENILKESNDLLEKTLSDKNDLTLQIKELEDDKSSLLTELQDTRHSLEVAQEALFQLSPETRKEFLECMVRSTENTSEQINKLSKQINLLQEQKNAAEKIRETVLQKLGGAQSQISVLENLLHSVESEYSKFYEMLQKERLNHLGREKTFKEIELRNRFLENCLKEYEDTIKLKNLKIQEISENRYKFKNAFELVTEKHVILRQNFESSQRTNKVLLDEQKKQKAENLNLLKQLQLKDDRLRSVNTENNELKERLNKADIILINRATALKELTKRFDEKKKQIAILLDTIKNLESRDFQSSTGVHVKNVSDEIF